MKYVYILQSIDVPERFYVGITENMKSRLKRHNSKQVSHSSKYAPWKVKTYVGFSDDERALMFEKYLKTAYGRAFAKKRL